MNTQLAFAFGMLAMVAVTMLIVIVVGMVKVIKLEKQAKGFHYQLDNVYRNITDVERNMNIETDQLRSKFDQHLDQLRRELTSYTDSRLDKATNTKEKQLLKS